MARRARSALFCFLHRRRGIIDRQHQLAQKLLTEARPCTIDRRTSREHQRVQQRAGSVLFKSRTTPPGRPRRPSWPFKLSAAASARSRSSSRSIEGHRPPTSAPKEDPIPCSPRRFQPRPPFCFSNYLTTTWDFQFGVGAPSCKKASLLAPRKKASPASEGIISCGAIYCPRRFIDKSAYSYKMGRHILPPRER